MRPPLWLNIEGRGADIAVSLAVCRNCGKTKVTSDACGLDHLAALMDFELTDTPEPDYMAGYVERLNAIQAEYEKPDTPEPVTAADPLPAAAADPTIEAIRALADELRAHAAAERPEDDRWDDGWRAAHRKIDARLRAALGDQP